MRYIKDNIISSNPTFSNVINPSHDFILSQGWEVYVEPEPTPYEIAMRDWENPNAAIRIVAPIELLKPKAENAIFHQFYGYFLAMGFTITKTATHIRIYLNEVEEEYQDFVDGLLIIQEEKPQP